MRFYIVGAIPAVGAQEHSLGGNATNVRRVPLLVFSETVRKERKTRHQAAAIPDFA